MAENIHIHFHDAGFEEGKHPRGEGGKFAGHTAVAVKHGWKSTGLGKMPEGHPSKTFQHASHPGHQLTIRSKYSGHPEWSHGVMKRTRRHGVSAGSSPESMERHLSEFHGKKNVNDSGTSEGAKKAAETRAQHSPYGGQSGSGYTKIPKKQLQTMHYAANKLHGETHGGHPEAHSHARAIYAELERRRRKGKDAKDAIADWLKTKKKNAATA